MTWGAQRIIIGAAAAAIVSLAAPTAFARTRAHVRHEKHPALTRFIANDMNLCRSKQDIAPATRIAKCTAVIDKSRSKILLAQALTERGKAYRAKGIPTTPPPISAGP